MTTDEDSHPNMDPYARMQQFRKDKLLQKPHRRQISRSERNQSQTREVVSVTSAKPQTSSKLYSERKQAQNTIDLSSRALDAEVLARLAAWQALYNKEDRDSNNTINDRMDSDPVARVRSQESVGKAKAMALGSDTKSNLNSYSEEIPLGKVLLRKLGEKAYGTIHEPETNICGRKSESGSSSYSERLPPVEALIAENEKVCQQPDAHEEHIAILSHLLRAKAALTKLKTGFPVLKSNNDDSIGRYRSIWRLLDELKAEVSELEPISSTCPPNAMPKLPESRSIGGDRPLPSLIPQAPNSLTIENQVAIEVQDKPARGYGVGETRNALAKLTVVVNPGSTTSSFFTRFSAEIRRQIYRELLCTSKMILGGELVEEKCMMLVIPAGRRLSDRLGIDSSILRSCRKAYEEALPILYQENSFCFQNFQSLQSFRTGGLTVLPCE